MSVYRDTNADVVFEHPHPGPLTATVYRDGTVILPAEDLTPSTGKYTLSLDWHQTGLDGTLVVVWTDPSDDTFKRQQAVQVVTPIVPLAHLRTLYVDENPTDAALAPLESSVRTIIKAFTGQDFGFSVGPKTMTTSGGRIVLDTRASAITEITGGDGYTLRASADGFTLYVERDDSVNPNNVIRAPWGRSSNIVPDDTFTVTGEWGYIDVPEDVQEAGLLLANDYLTGDSGYRDRYLYILKIQQDSFTYHPGAYRGTGNARADLLLAPYRRKTGMIIL